MDRDVASEIFILSLTLIFVVAKIMGRLNWTWWWVFSPLWLPFVVFLCLLAAIFVVALLKGFIGGFKEGVADAKAREKMWKR